MTEQILQPVTTLLIVEDSKSDRPTNSHNLQSDSENDYRIIESETLNHQAELEAKVAERTQALWQVNSLQRAIFDSTDYAIISTDLNGIIQTFNAGAEEMLGYSMGEVVGQVTPEIFYDSQEINDKIAKASIILGKDIGLGFGALISMAMEGLIGEELTKIRKDGSRFPADISMTVLKDDNEQIIGTLTVGRDVSDRKQAEYQLQKSSDRLALALKSGAIGCWELAIPQNTIDCDERMYELYGISKETDSHQLFDILVNAIHPEDRKATLTLFQEAILGHAEYDCEFRVIHPDRSIHFIKANGKVVRDNQGNSKCMIGINFDISERKKAEAYAYQQLIQKQALFHITQSILLTLDIPQILEITVNKTREIFNLDRVAFYRFKPDWGGEFIVESVGDDWVKLIENGVHKTWDDSYLQETQGGRFRKHECMIVPDIYQADLQPCHIEMLERMQARAYMIAPIFINGILWGLLGLYKNDQPYAWQSWQIDLLEQTEKQVAIAIHQANLYEQIQSELAIRKQTELQLLRVNYELLSATKLKDEFLANMSHELRTPLNSILGLSEALHEQLLGTLNKKQLKAIGTVASSGEHLLSLINDILDLSKITSGMMKLNTESVSVKKLCESSLTFIKQQAFNKRIQVFSNIPLHINRVRPRLNTKIIG